MSDYDELVKRLREPCQYENCILCQQAADAIEELGKCLGKLNEAHNEGYDVGYWAGRRDYERKWIPVSERLPGSQEEVIVSVCDETGDTRYNYASHGWLTTDKEYWIVDDEINNYVVAWMPLPEPYKEERG